MSATTGFAQQAPLEPPRVLFESAGGTRILDDFEQMLDLAGKQGAEQKEGLLILLEGFLVGVAPNAAVRIEPLTKTKPTRYRIFIPVNNRRNWQQNNLNLASGIPSRKMAGFKDRFKLGFVRDAAFSGYMQYYPSEDGGPEYAVIVEQQEDLPARVVKIGALLNAGQDASMLLQNKAGSQEAVARRWDRVEEAKMELISRLQKTAEESSERFALRKAAAAFQVAAGGRFYAESGVVFLSGDIPNGAIGGVSS
ncbi:MAG: hypothetical protein AAF907_12680, partial [Planctomycetota bacterium]